MLGAVSYSKFPRFGPPVIAACPFLDYHLRVRVVLVWNRPGLTELSKD